MEHSFSIDKINFLSVFYRIIFMKMNFVIFLLVVEAVLVLGKSAYQDEGKSTKPKLLTKNGKP